MKALFLANVSIILLIPIVVFSARKQKGPLVEAEKALSDRIARSPDLDLDTVLKRSGAVVVRYPAVRSVRVKWRDDSKTEWSASANEYTIVKVLKPGYYLQGSGKNEPDLRVGKRIRVIDSETRSSKFTYTAGRSEMPARKMPDWPL
ncbi:MAG: hypothetical protein V4760_15335, partial [Bdellovibrionota bacterium]